METGNRIWRLAIRPRSLRTWRFCRGRVTGPFGRRFISGPSPQVVATGDFDNNLKPDIAVANQIFPSGSSVAAGTILMNGATVGPLPTLVQGGVKSVVNGAGLSPPGSLIYAQGT